MTALKGDGIYITREDPLGADLALLHRRHTEAMHADTPPESIHMLPASALAAPDISFYVLRDTVPSNGGGTDGAPLAMGALKVLDPADGDGTGGHAEIKSMHVLAEARGRGLARALLLHLIAEAQAAGMSRLSLETGAQDSFAPARALYAAEGFTGCAPFGSYGPDPMSCFMTLDLAARTRRDAAGAAAKAAGS